MEITENIKNCDFNDSQTIKHKPNNDKSLLDFENIVHTVEYIISLGKS